MVDYFLDYQIILLRINANIYKNQLENSNTILKHTYFLYIYRGTYMNNVDHFINNIILRMQKLLLIIVFQS